MPLCPKERKVFLQLYHQRKGGDRMYLDTVKKVTDVENEVEQQKTAARAQVQQQLADAEKAGKALLEEARCKARSESGVRLQDTEQQAAQRREATLRAAQEEQQALRQTAESRMARAAEEIVRRVVDR